MKRCSHRYPFATTLNVCRTKKKPCKFSFKLNVNVVSLIPLASTAVLMNYFGKGYVEKRFGNFAYDCTKNVLQHCVITALGIIFVPNCITRMTETSLCNCRGLYFSLECICVA